MGAFLVEAVPQREHDPNAMLPSGGDAVSLSGGSLVWITAEIEFFHRGIIQQVDGLGRHGDLANR